jgi:hypothetical protein
LYLNIRIGDFINVFGNPPPHRPVTTAGNRDASGAYIVDNENGLLVVRALCLFARPSLMATSH